MKVHDDMVLLDMTKINAGTVKEKNCHKHKGSLRRSAGQYLYILNVFLFPILTDEREVKPILEILEKRNEMQRSPLAQRLL